jgi:hypothetical protein
MQPPSDSQSNSARWLLTAAAVVSGLLLLRICLAADRGFDLSDEGFNLLGMQDPSRYGLLPTLFGFVLHPIYEAVGGSIGRLRLLNFVATFGLGLFFFASLLSTTLGARLLTRSERLMTAVALSASSLALFDTWLVTPSYNGLALHGTLIAAACTLRVAAPRPWPWLLGIGFGGWLVFMAKPPASALIALMVLAHIWACSKRPWQSALVAGGFALLLLIATAFAVDGSLLGFVGRFQAAAAQVAGTDHHLGALFRLGLPRMGRAQLLGAGVAVALGTAPIWLRGRFGAGAVMGRIAPGCLLGAAALAVGLADGGPVKANAAKGMLLLAPLVTVLIWRWGQGERGTAPAGAATRPPREARATLLFLLALPFGYAFGTNNSLWFNMSLAGCFWVGAAVWLGQNHPSVSHAKERLVSVTAVAVAVSAALVMSGLNYPHRQSRPILEQEVPVAVRGSQLKLTPAAADIVRRATASSQQAGLQVGELVIDLTGRSPGLVYAIAGTSQGLPWVVGGYPTSQESLLRLLRSIPCDRLATGWLLVEPGGPRSLDAEAAIRSYGAALTSDFAKVGSWLGAEQSGWPSPPGEQQLYRPSRSVQEATSACEQLRRGSL